MRIRGSPSGAWFLVLVVSLLAAGCSTRVTDEPPVQDASTSTTVAPDVADRRFRDCMASRGFAVVPEGTQGDAGTQYGIDTGGQVEAFKDAIPQCMEEAGLSVAAGTEPPSPEYLAGYSDFLVTLRTCLDAQGYATAAPPSKETFIDSGGQAWTGPYGDLLDLNLDQDEWQRLNAACPQNYQP
jgi:hypothetical protein